MIHRFGWALTGALALIAVLALARAIEAGPLDPPGPVGSTMQTIDELLPSWGKQLSANGGCNSKRFTCVLPTASNPTGEGVLDHETGLVWQRDVSGNPPENFATARLYCTESNLTIIGDREGWRLPTREELQTLRDINTADYLPAGHPFIGTSAQFWTTTPDDLTRGARYWVAGIDPNVGETTKDPADSVRYWCVRGGTAQDDALGANDNSWSQTLSATGGCGSQRFSCVMGGTAVLDHETGLVWERTPASTTTGWQLALETCLHRTTGGRQGWRAPTIAEAFSLIDPTTPTGLNRLPIGSPFTVLVAQNYVTSSVVDATGGFAFAVDGTSVLYNSRFTPTNAASWCVRGPGDGGASS